MAAGLSVFCVNAGSYTYKALNDLTGIWHRLCDQLFSTSGGRVPPDQIYRNQSIQHQIKRTRKCHEMPEVTQKFQSILALLLPFLLFLPATLFAQSSNNTRLSFLQLTDSTIHYFQKLGDCERALPFALPRRDSIRKKYGPWSLEYAKTCRFVGEVFTRLSRFEEAEASFQLALPLADSLLPEGDGRRANFYSAYGFFQLEKGDFRTAVAFYRKAIALQPLKSRKDSIDWAWQERYLGKACYLRNLPAEAEEHLSRALKLFRLLYGPVHLEVATACHFLGNFHYHIRNFHQAMVWLKKAGESLPGLENRQALIEAIEIKIIASSACIKLKNYNVARLYITEAEVLLQKLCPPGHFPDIPDRLNQAKLNINLGLIEFYENAFQDAEIAFRLALNKRESLLPAIHPDVQNTRLNLALVLAYQGSHRQADSLFALVRKGIDEELDYESNRLNLLSLEQARYALARGRWQEARQHIDSLEQNIRQQIDAIFLNFATSENEAFLLSMDLYREWISGMLASEAEQQPAMAERLLDVHLRLHGILLSTEKSVLQDLRHKNEPELAQKAENWFILRKELARLQADGKIKSDSLTAFEEKVNRLEKELIRQRRNKTSLATRARPGAEIQKMLKKGQAAVQIIRVAMPGLVTFTDRSASLHRNYVYPDITDTIHYLALIIKPGRAGLERVFLRNGNWLEKQGMASYRNRMRWQETDRFTYSYFWKSIDSALGNEVKEVYYSPDGFFHLLNPASVLVPEQNRFMGESRNWVRLTRLQELLEPAPDFRSARTAVLAGAPAFSPHGYHLNPADSVSVRFDSLPGTQTEINAIAKGMRAKGWKVKQLTGNRATEDALKEIRNPEVLHLATHGYFRENSLGGSHTLLNAGLILARSDSSHVGIHPEDGVLKAREALTMDLEETRLVVLSACETGLGTSMAGEGMYGLQRAFQLAGSRHIVMSLWKIDDEATSRLMMAFYKYYLPTGNPQEALRKAQTDLRKIYPHPYFWASFVVLGV
jgi:CHAT domain-containing protein